MIWWKMEEWVVYDLEDGRMGSLWFEEIGEGTKEASTNVVKCHFLSSWDSWKEKLLVDDLLLNKPPCLLFPDQTFSSKVTC